MRVLFDQGTPRPLRRRLADHAVTLSKDLGWDRLRNGDLLRAAELAGFDVLVTTDKNIRYQQNLATRVIAIVVPGNGQWPALEPHAQRVAEAVGSVLPGGYVEIEIPVVKSGRAPDLRS